MATVEASHFGGACKYCKGTNTYVDQSTGDHVCLGCGTVLEERCIDMGCEWRSFKLEGVHSGMNVESRQRAELFVDEVDEALFEESAPNSLGTLVDGSDMATKRLQGAQRMTQHTTAAPASAEDKYLRNAVAKVRELGKLMDLSENITARCKALLKKLGEKRLTLTNPASKQSRGKAPVLNEQTMLSVVYLACREEQVGRTIKEIVHTSNPDRQNMLAMEKSVEKKVIEHKKELGAELNNSARHYVPPEDLMSRFTSKLNLSQQVCNVAASLVNKVYNRRELEQALKAAIGRRTSPENAIVAAAIFAVAWLMDFAVKPSISEVAVVAKVPESDVRNAYNRLRPEVAVMLPEANRSGRGQILPDLSGAGSAMVQR
mmetsp:Transcript_198/g.651  ORF Transcript_198/g.651 Transcript_198/m.651 type:complete len:374 (-) Transcript_198:52-1173(-)